MLLAEQPVHQRFVQPGPLVLGSTLLKSPTPTADRDRTVSRRSEPRSRTALMGEQPKPWDLLQPQDATIRHRGAKPPRRCGDLQSLAAQTIPSSLSRALRIMNAIDLRRCRRRTSIPHFRVKSLQGTTMRHALAGVARRSLDDDCSSLGIARDARGFHRYEQ